MLTSERSIPSTLDEVPPRTLTEWVTRKLRDDICHGLLEPGQVLWQDRLAETYQISRVPIRVALRQLAAEGLVSLRSHRSAVVAELSADEVQELYAMIITLESLALRRGVLRLTAQDTAKMSHLLFDLEKTTQSPIAWYDLHCKFHNVVIEAANWKRLTGIINMYRKNVFRYVAVSEFFHQNVGFWNETNRRLLASCKARDADEAAAVIDELGSRSLVAVQVHVGAGTPPMVESSRTSERVRHRVAAQQ